MEIETVRKELEEREKKIEVAKAEVCKMMLKMGAQYKDVSIQKWIFSSLSNLNQLLSNGPKRKSQPP